MKSKFRYKWLTYEEAALIPSEKSVLYYNLYSSNKFTTRNRNRNVIQNFSIEKFRRGFFFPNRINFSTYRFLILNNIPDSEFLNLDQAQRIVNGIFVEKYTKDKKIYYKRIRKFETTDLRDYFHEGAHESSYIYFLIK